MDPQTKRTLTAHTAAELRDEIIKALDTERVERASGKKVYGVDGVMITVFYKTDNGHGELVFGVAPETVHTNAQVMRELIR